jgi:uncharacterized protein (TIGR04222 family)
MILPVLAFVLGLLPGVAAFYFGRGPRGEGDAGAGRPPVPLPEVAVLRDGAVGATRWAFAALVVKLARNGHCTLVRTRRRRWLRTGPVVAVDLHADPTACSPFEQAVLRQLARHDTLDGFGFAGSTFRRRTLRDVRADLIDRGWLADRRRRSTACLLGGGLLLGTSGAGLWGGLPPVGGAAGLGLGVGALAAGLVRYPVTDDGARIRAAHRAHAQRQWDRIRDRLPDDPARAASRLEAALPSLVLERLATPSALGALADRFDEAGPTAPPPGWLRDEVDGLDTVADGCRALAAVLVALGARKFGGVGR